ncbi:hypothetical protein [Polymorphospora lycopeni]|uniref:Uncharacterized protein n=1 Tax=Polymorphospora lycopeni TaxID=3140240 RepID=A0ABV5CKX5_9ACTN
MKRSKALSALAAIAATAAVGLAPSPAYANPTTPFNLYSGLVGGEVRGTLTWYNRSVGIQGEVCDSAGPDYTQVQFAFYQGGTPLADDGYPPQTRAVTAGCKPFNFTQSGPSGGITDIRLKLFSASNSSPTYWIYRPS